ncbi:hypothetical protein [Photobacterium leiognathi]|uniref:hypothetical protein n=1 Tax=Photobacterium leiognathi TaxID=553611 RepID=UPI00273244B6|nr:hypothetical protein [Photobacterium leiognathi]
MYKIFIMLIILSSSSAYSEENYQIPPSSSTRSSVPVISDAKMEQCVKLYNEAKWLFDDIGRMNVDRYSQESVDHYNREVQKHRLLTDKFNSGCAGKSNHVLM